MPQLKKRKLSAQETKHTKKYLSEYLVLTKDLLDRKLLTHPEINISTSKYDQ